MSVQNVWTDEELAFLADHEHWPAKRVAEALGRPTQGVWTKRYRLRQGWEQKAFPWTDDENDVIRENSHCTADQLAEKLPGRSAEAIATQRRRIGAERTNEFRKNPYHIGARPLIAKTCIDCGLLLQADWYTFIEGLRQWRPKCKKCQSQRAMELFGGKKWNERSQRSSAASLAAQQAMTLPYATRAREPWTEDDYKVLADPDLTHVQKALKLHRSYVAVRGRCSTEGFKSHKGLGDPKADQWIIYNPNEPLFPEQENAFPEQSAA